jgi:NAD(P)-dependent dehydrogenase (short-subunit alcohol dehydrogenase family)
MSSALVITGGSRGIGAATARLAAARGYDVCINYRANRTAADSVVAAIEAAGQRGLAVQGNVAEEADVVRLFDAAGQALGRITGVVNNAGIVGPASPAAEVPLAALREVFDINVLGAFLVAREAVRRMSAARGGAGGAIVNLSSMAAFLGGPGEFVHYAVSKGAIETLTIGLSREVARQGIRVNAVAPGLIDTEIHASAGLPDRLERMAPTVPLGRGGSAEEVAEAILWLLSDAASYVTGASLRVSGGR